VTRCFQRLAGPGKVLGLPEIRLTAADRRNPHVSDGSAVCLHLALYATTKLVTGLGFSGNNRRKFRLTGFSNLTESGAVRRLELDLPEQVRSRYPRSLVGPC
jgi:hypothetical protein